MNRSVQAIFTLLVLPVAFACDRKPEAAAAPAPAASQPVEKRIVERPATRPVSMITISDRPVLFPPAKLVLQQNASGVTATLFSDDPPEAVKDDYRGNSFRFEISFDNATLDDVTGQQFVWKNSADDKPDSLTGIFLNGQQQSIQPLAATMTLMKVGQQWTANIGGEFQYVDNQKADAQPLTIHVYADIAADLVTVPTKP